MVGASFTATFSEQSTKWPPYRIINRTSLTVRFRQHFIPDVGFSDILFPPTFPPFTNPSSENIQKNVQKNVSQNVRPKFSTACDDKDFNVLAWNNLAPR